MCLQRDNVQFGWMTNYHSTVFITTSDPAALQQVWQNVQDPSVQQPMLEIGTSLQKYRGSTKVFLSRIVSCDTTDAPLLRAYRAFSKLAALVGRACAAYDADQQPQAAPAAVQPAQEPEPSTKSSSKAEPAAKRQRRSTPPTRTTCAAQPSLEPSTSGSSASCTTTDMYDMAEFKFVGRLGDHCFDTFWRGSRLALKYNERHEDEITHEVRSPTVLSFCMLCNTTMCSPWHGQAVGSCGTTAFLGISHGGGQPCWALSVGCAGFRVTRSCSRKTSLLSIPAATS